MSVPRTWGATDGGRRCCVTSATWPSQRSSSASSPSRFQAPRFGIPGSRLKAPRLRHLRPSGLTTASTRTEPKPGEHLRLEGERNRFRWKLVQSTDQIWQLANTGTEDAHDVALSLDSGAFISSGRAADNIGYDPIKAGLGKRVMIAGGADILSVRWREQDDPVELVVNRR